MARKFLTALDLAKNELQNGVIQNLASAPSSPVKGQLYFDSTGNILYWWNGTVWVSAAGGGGGAPTGPAGGDLSGTYPNPTVVKSTADFTVNGDALLPAASSQIAFAAAASGVGRIQMPANGTTGADGITWGAYVPGSTGIAIHRKASDYLLIDAFLLEVNCQLDMKTHNISGVSTPVAVDHAANKGYVDALQNGLSWKEPVRAATTANITLSAPQTIDGVAVIAGERVLVKDQTTQTQNGVYTVAAGAWTRAADADAATELEAMSVFVMEGTTLADTSWVLTTNAPIVVGTSNLTYVQFAGPGAVIAGAGLTSTGSTLDVGAGTGIAVTANAVAVNGAVVAYWTAISHASNVGGATSVTVAHNLGTRDCLVDVYRVAAPYDSVECDVERTDVNNVTLRFATAPAAAEYRCVIFAKAG